MKKYFVYKDAMRFVEEPTALGEHLVPDFLHEKTVKELLLEDPQFDEPWDCDPIEFDTIEKAIDYKNSINFKVEWSKNKGMFTVPRIEIVCEKGEYEDGEWEAEGMEVVGRFSYEGNELDEVLARWNK